MGKIRKKHSPQFKAKVALAAIQNDETITQIASRYSRKQAQAENDELYRQIGNLKVENDFLSRKLGS
jgi:transposase-like protein